MSRTQKIGLTTAGTDCKSAPAGMGKSKKEKIFALLFSACMFCACCEKRTEIIYTYEDLTITRIDRCSKSYFYYSNPNVKKDVGYIWTEYHGLTNSWFNEFIEFDTINSKVIIYEGCCFYGKNLDTTFFVIRKYNEVANRGTIDHIHNLKNSPNCYEIVLATNAEKEWNAERGVSKVAVYYKE